MCGATTRAGLRFCTGCGGMLNAAAIPTTPAPPSITVPPARAALATNPAPLPVHGPVDRVTFFAEQARHRRATWRVTAMCAVAAVVTGVPLSLVLTPVLFAIVLIATRLLDLMVPVPLPVWDAYRRVALTFGTALDLLDDTKPRPADAEVARRVILAAAVWLLPGMTVMAGFWPVMRRLFHRAALGGALLTLGARPPRSGDTEERELENVVAEMALAAGLPAPRLLLLDVPEANVAAIGSGPEDAVVLVTRAALDRLDRRQTQGALAHVIASVGNGDLRIGLRIIAVYQTFGLASALIKSPFSPRARVTLRRLFRYTFHLRVPDRAAESEALTRLLMQNGWESEFDDVDRLIAAAERLRAQPNMFFNLLFYVPAAALGIAVYAVLQEWDRGTALLAEGTLAAVAGLIALSNIVFIIQSLIKGTILGLLLVSLPYYIAAMLPQVLLRIMTSFVLGPLVALAWRTRRYLADAAAVQLTRDPDAVAGALVALSGGVPAGAGWATPLFVVGGGAGRAARADAAAAHAHLAAIRSAMASDPAAARQAVEALRTAQAEAESGASSTPSALGAPSSIIGFHPSLDRRLRRLQAQGATVAVPRSTRRRFYRESTPLGWLVLFLIPVLMAIAAVLMVVAVVLLTALSLLFCGILMAAVYALFTVLIM